MSYLEDLKPFNLSLSGRFASSSEESPMLDENDPLANEE